jgi:hypothetical protein
MGRPLTESVLTDVATVVKTAWSCGQVRVGRPLTIPTAYPAASVQARQITVLGGSPTQTTYRYEIRVTGRFAYPNSPIDFIGREQIERANDLIDALMNSSTLSAVSYGTLLEVSDFDFSENDEDSDRYYVIAATFSIAINGTVRP